MLGDCKVVALKNSIYGLTMAPSQRFQNLQNTPDFDPDTAVRLELPCACAVNHFFGRLLLRRLFCRLSPLLPLLPLLPMMSYNKFFTPCLSRSFISQKVAQLTSPAAIFTKRTPTPAAQARTPELLKPHRAPALCLTQASTPLG
jgi:hypothetical protein